MRKTGFIEGNRVVVAPGIPTMNGVPAALIPGQLDWYGLYEDFVKGLVTDTAGLFSPPGWSGDLTGAASICTIANVVGGRLTLTTGAADEDTLQLTYGNGVIPSGGAFLVADGNDIWFEALLQHTLVGQTNVGIGLMDPANTDYLTDAGGALVQPNFIMFVTQDGDANWFIAGNKAAAGVDKNTTGIARAANTDITLGFHVSGVTPNYICDCYVNRVLIAAAQLPFASIPLTYLMPFIAIKTGHAGAESMTVDYIMCVQAR